MRLMTFDAGAGVRIGALQGDRIVDVQNAVLHILEQRSRRDQKAEAESIVPADMTALLHRSDGDFSLIRKAVANAFADGHFSIDAAQARVLAPVPKPGKIIGVGRNYGAHAKEGALGRQDEPRLFVKMTSSVIGPNDPIVRPTGVTKLDWEVELAVVIGRRLKNVAEHDVWKYVAGYTILNDVSAREFQFDVAPPQTTFAKSMDGFAPMGPVLLTSDEIDPTASFDLRCLVNNELMQEGATSDMIFPIPRILAYIGKYVSLEPGDIVATGTPAGVGHFRTPPRYLVPGDVLRSEISHLGAIENPIS